MIIFDNFTNINDEETLYWLGFLAADGYIVKSDVKVNPYRKIGIGLNIKDLEHLKKFKSFTGSPNYIQYKSDNTVEFRFTSLEAANNLISLGITPNKSKTLKVHDVLYCSRHFWRGVIDGDGHLSSERISLCSASLEFMYQYSSFLWEYLGISSNICKGSRCYTISTCRPRFTLFNYLYSDSTIPLKRKHEHPSFTI